MSDEISSFDVPPGEGLKQHDAHAGLEPRDALTNASVVIASHNNDNRTARSTPGWLEAIVRTEEGRNRARNAGVIEANGQWIIICDDDITFPTTLASILIDGMHKRHVVGLEDFWPMNWLLTRFMIFHRSLWDAIGGFDESREHGGDTDFCIRCEKAGAQLHGLPRFVVPHHDVDTSFDRGNHIEWFWYLAKRHPINIIPRAGKLVFEKLGIINPPQDYSEDWTARVGRYTDTIERDAGGPK
jgi:glycosyltransferase involved in cell wall biosynthesis